MRTFLATGCFFSVVISGCGQSTEPFVTAEPPQASQPAPEPTTEAVAPIKVTADGKGFTPRLITAKKGKPLTIEFTRTTDQTCATSVVFPELKITKALPLNTPVLIDIPTDEARTYVFQCSMAMYKSKVVVE